MATEARLYQNEKSEKPWKLPKILCLNQTCSSIVVHDVKSISSLWLVLCFGCIVPIFFLSYITDNIFSSAHVSLWIRIENSPNAASHTNFPLIFIDLKRKIRLKSIHWVFGFPTSIIGLQSFHLLPLLWGCFCRIWIDSKKFSVFIVNSIYARDETYFKVFCAFLMFFGKSEFFVWNSQYSEYLASDMVKMGV